MGAGSIESKIGKAFFWNSLILPMSGIASFLGLIFIARFLSLHDFGIYAIINSIIILCIGYGDLGISTAASKSFPELAVKVGKKGVSRLLKYLFQLRCAVGCLTFFLILLFARFFASWLNLDGQYLFIFPYIGMIVFLDSLYYLFHNLLWSTFEQKKANLMTLGFTVLQPVLIVAFILYGWGIRGILLAMGTTSLLRVVGFVILGTLKVRYMEEVKGEKSSFEENYLRRFVRLSLFGYFDKVSSHFFSIPFVTLILAMYLNKEEIAIFSLAGEFTLRFLSLSLTPTHGWVLPLFSTVFTSHDEGKIRSTFSQTLKIITFLSVPVGTFLFVFSHQLVPYLYTEKFLSAVPIARVLTVFYFLEYTVLAAANGTLIAGEKLKTYFWIKMIFFLCIPLYFIVVPLGGLIGAAYFYGIVRLSVGVTLISAAIRIFKFVFPSEFYGKLILSAGIMASLSEIMTKIIGISFTPNTFVLSVEILVFLTVFYLIIRRIKLFGGDEKELLLSMNIPYARRLIHWI